MRKAELKTPPASLTGVPRVRVVVEPSRGDDDLLAGRLRLLEGFVGRVEISDCAQFALQWLGEVLGVRPSICLVRGDGEQTLFVAGAYGLSDSAVRGFAISTEDCGHPLVPALTNRKHLFFPAPHSSSNRKRRPSTPFEGVAFHVVPLGVSGCSDEAFGLLLVGGAAPLRPDVQWFTSVFSRKLDQILRQQTLLRRQAIALEQASALKSQFLANMSHEFRTPLNAMLGYTSMLLQGVAGSVEPPVKRQLNRIESNGRHLLTIINEILDISRIEAGRMPLQRSTFRIPDLVGEVMSELEPIIMRSKLAVTLDLPKHLEPIVSDRQKVKQILLNLLSNSLKFTHDGGVTITVRRHVEERTVTLSVADTGIGIAAADQDKIFEDFRQLDNSPTRAYGGTGLGLAMCRRLSQMLEGRMSVESQVGQGSTFTLTLPSSGRA